MKPYQNKEFIKQAKEMTSVSFGGDGGASFETEGVKTLRLRTSDSYVNAIVINGKQHGQNGGEFGEEITLEPFEFIRKIVVRYDEVVKYLHILTSRGQIIEGGAEGGTEKSTTGVIVALGGRSGELLDRLDIVGVLGPDYV